MLSSKIPSINIQQYYTLYQTVQSLNIRKFQMMKSLTILNGNNLKTLKSIEISEKHKIFQRISSQTSQNYNFYYLIDKMNSKRLINFSYSQAQSPPTEGHQYILSQHIINCPKLLRFTYRNPYPQLRIEKIISFFSATYAPSAELLQEKREEPSISSKGINLTISKHLRTKSTFNAYPKSPSTELQEDHRIQNRLKSDKLLSHLENYQEIKHNPESGYTYVLPNHIKFQFDDKPNCDLFSICTEKYQRQQVQVKDNANFGKNTTISRRRILQEKEAKPLTRHKIFEPEKITQFIIKQKKQQQESIHKPQIFGETQSHMMKPYHFQQKQSQIKSVHRKPIFDTFESSQQKKVCKISQQNIQVNDIPEFVFKNWQNQVSEIKQQKFTSFYMYQSGPSSIHEQ